MKKPIYSNSKIYLALLLIIVFAFLCRLQGLSWDNGWYLHPDERFLVMTATSLKWPTSLAEYLNPQTSLLNPYNVGVNFFVYGHFPLILAKGVAIFTNHDSYALFYRVGRTITMIVDTSAVLACFLLAKKIFAKHQKQLTIALFASLSYSLMVLPFQQAHFFTTDSFLNAFMLYAVVFMLYFKKQWIYLLLSAAFWALALSAKINAVFFLPLLVFLLLKNKQSKTPQNKIINLSIFALSSYLFLRLFYPYLFAQASWFNFWPDPRYLQNLKDLSALGKSTFYPPGVQWLNTNWQLPFKNIILYGLGPGLSLLFVIGLVIVIKNYPAFSKRTVCLLRAILIWSLVYFVWQSSQLGKTMRYYLPLYPFLALFIAVALTYLNKFWRLLLILPGLIWFFAFAQIYTVPHSRITASAWLNDNIPQNSLIISEYWDDPLPLYPNPQKNLQLVQLDFYQTDSLAKWQALTQTLAKSDYLVLSSNRLYGSIPRVPELYPNASQYYQKLLNQELGFRLEKKFTVFPQIKLGPYKLEIDDQQAEEAFTVYDHPQVLIFKRQKTFNDTSFLKKIGF